MLSVEQEQNNYRLKLVTLFPEAENVHLTKDVGMVAFVLHKHFGYDSILACYHNGNYPYLQHEVKGLRIDFLDRINDSVSDGCAYIIKYAKEIDILHLFHLNERTLQWIPLYKALNPQGKVYLKLDANIQLQNMHLGESVINVLKLCHLISVETKYLHEYLNKVWPVPVAYIANGFYDFYKPRKVAWDEKENIICTVGRIGAPVKAHDVLLKAFKIAAPSLADWKLKLIGPIDSPFKTYIDNYFTENPELMDRVVFTGEILDKQLLAEEYRKAKIFCLTSLMEGFPLVFPEAAKNGCFIISSDLLAAWDVTANKKYGEIFEIGNIHQLAGKLVEIGLDELKNQEVCNDLQEFAEQNFSWSKLCKEINDIIRYR